jgi:hypothetical protein
MGFHLLRFAKCLLRGHMWRYSSRVSGTRVCMRCGWRRSA